MALLIKVDVIIAVHNAESTIEETARSAMRQIIPDHLLEKRFSCKQPSHTDETEFSTKDIKFDVLVCCYNDASTDKSLEILYKLEEDSSSCYVVSESNQTAMPTKLVVGTAVEGKPSRGAGYARNQAIKLRDRHEHGTAFTQTPFQHFLCILDSDDLMHPTRIAEQTCAMLSLGYNNDGQHVCKTTLMGSQFDRIPADSTWHYQNWANSLTDDRLCLEQFRECTLIQPTWFMSKSWFDSVGGYLEAPQIQNENRGIKRKHNDESGNTTTNYYQLIHPSELAPPKGAKEKSSLRLAEDSRFFYAHLLAGGSLRLHRTTQPLVSYRHRCGMSQSSSTPRKLLLKLRAKAWEDLVYYGKSNIESKDISTIWKERGFAIWGAGRDGKDFLKALSPEVASSVVCFVDVDQKKIEHIKFYDNPSIGKRIPILHFSSLKNRAYDNSRPQESEVFGRIDKRKEHALSHLKSQAGAGQCKGDDVLECAKDDGGAPHQQHDNSPLSKDDMASLPVVVCVAMYRSNGALESNVASIGRTEGEDLWHIC